MTIIRKNGAQLEGAFPANGIPILGGFSNGALGET